MVLPTSAPIGEVGRDGIALRLPSGSRVSSIRFDFCEDAPRFPSVRRVTEPHVDLERLPVGILRRLRPSGILIHPAGLMPADGNVAWFAQSRESLARFFIASERILVATLEQANRSKLALEGSDGPVGT